MSRPTVQASQVARSIVIQVRVAKCIITHQGIASPGELFAVQTMLTGLPGAYMLCVCGGGGGGLGGCVV